MESLVVEVEEVISLCPLTLNVVETTESVLVEESETLQLVSNQEESQTLLLEQQTEEVVLLNEVVEETEEVVSKPVIVDTAEWESYTNYLRTWHSRSIETLKSTLDLHYQTAQELLANPNNNILSNKLTQFNKIINDPGDLILDQIYIDVVAPKIKQMPTVMKEPWANALKQVEYAFSQEVQPILEEYFKKLQNIQKLPQNKIQQPKKHFY